MSLVLKSEGFERGGCSGRERVWLGVGEEKRGRKLRQLRRPENKISPPSQQKHGNGC